MIKDFFSRVARARVLAGVCGCVAGSWNGRKKKREGKGEKNEEGATLLSDGNGSQ